MLKVVIVGAGGLGTPASWGLLSSWHGLLPTLELHIYDPDSLELSNLNRQVLYRENDLGKNKAGLLKQSLHELFPQLANVKIYAHENGITRENIASSLRGANYLIECSDSTETKFLINDYCLAHKIPFCYAGVIAERGLLLEVLPGEAHSACLRCLFGDFTEEDFQAQNNTCQQAGIFGPVAGFVGFLQAERAFNYLIKASECLTGANLMRFKLSPLTINESRLNPNPDCLLTSSTRLATEIVKLDLCDRECPATFLYTKLMLEKIAVGAKLEVYFSSQESLNNVARTMSEMGHWIEGREFDTAKGTWSLQIRKT